ncbi:MAG: hypothetical protein JJU06_22280 [Ectothiorhodospiraceae bacterium]|nr:hypothetical protein [Ectothiorhodospiraceae bacterium]MCH8506795.1 hypothetical protein [Ectothiorhodospiraceae bacterium]
MASIAMRDLNTTPSQSRNAAPQARGGSGALQGAYRMGMRLGHRRMLSRWLSSQPFVFAQQTAVAVNAPDYQYAFVQQTAYAFGANASITQVANIFQGALFGGNQNAH